MMTAAEEGRGDETETGSNGKDLTPNEYVFTAALTACENDPDDSAAAAAAQQIVDTMAVVGVTGMNEDLRSRLARQARRMLGRDAGQRDIESLSKDEEALGMSLKGRQSAV